MKTLPLLAGATLTMVSACLSADSVSLMEHGRAEIVNNLIDQNIEPEKRLEKLAILKRSQMNLEQIVVRDGDLDSRNSRNSQLFSQFERNFLVHSSYEANRSLGEHWFYIIGLSSDRVRSAQIGKR